MTVERGAIAHEDFETFPTSTAALGWERSTPTVLGHGALSPNTATMRSEAPFSPLGPSKETGAELMKAAETAPRGPHLVEMPSAA